MVKKTLFNKTWLEHGTIIPAGITCKKILCFMPDSACRGLLLKSQNILKLC